MATANAVSNWLQYCRHQPITAITDLFCNRLRLYNYRAKIAASFLRKKRRQCKTPLDHLNVCYNIFHHLPWNHIGWPIAPAQVKEEILVLLNMLREQKVQAMLEIGTANGGTLYLFSQMIGSNAKIISLDLPSGRFGGGYESFKIPFFTNFAQDNQHIFLIRTDSHAPSSYAKVKTILNGQPLDFLFIDGDHTYEGVKKDFEMYSPFVRSGGLIALHDICKHPSETGCEVHKFWNELRNGYSHQEIIYDKKQNWAGIGILQI